MKGGSINTSSPGKAANQTKAANSLSAPTRKTSPTTAPKAALPSASPKSLSNKVSAPRKGTSLTPKPKALATSVRTPNKTAHNRNVRKTDFHSQAHKQRLAKQGEDAARRAFRKEKVFNRFPSMKHNGIQGIDFAALKLGANGKIKKAAVVESKASRNRNLGPASVRDQTTHRYVQQSLLKAKIKKVKYADKLYEMAKNKKLSIIGSTYNKETGRVRLHRRYEPRTAKPEQPKNNGSTRRK
jgi:hypothetical protein